MEWEDDPQDRAPMTEAIDTIEALRAELAECKQEIIDRHNAEENLKQSWIDLDDETKALRARVAELEYLLRQHQNYSPKQSNKKVEVTDCDNK